MNGPGQSDRPVVPTKSPNNAGRPAAEEMEGRGLVKGNLGQLCTDRTQRRGYVHQALARVRGAGSGLRVSTRDKSRMR
jgi:hypothetical protein